MSKAGVADSKVYGEYGLFVARSPIGREPGIGIFLISVSLLVDCKFQSLCQEDKINERLDVFSS